MPPIPAVFENGVFRPTAPVNLSDGTTAQVHPKLPPPTEADPEPTPEQLEARKRVYEILSRSYGGGEPSNILETHNDHQP